MEEPMNVWTLLIPILFVLVFVIPAIKQVEEGNRIVVERFGRYRCIRGPGWHFLLPFIDRGIRVNLNAQLPGWQGMTEREIETKIRLQHYGAE